MIRVLITDTMTRRGGVGVGGWVMVGDIQQGKTHRRGWKEDSVSHASRNLFHLPQDRGKGRMCKQMELEVWCQKVEKVLFSL